MTGIIDIGGGLRGIFGTGVFDRCLDEKISFDHIIGVSAGAANAASFLGGQKGRNFLFYTEYAKRPQYMSFGNILKNGSYLDLSYIYGALSNSDGENPLNYENFSKFNGTFLTVATDCITGKPVYFPKEVYKKDDYRVLMASSCLPVLCRPVDMNGTLCVDGGASDPVPVKKALLDGCDKLVLILSRPKNEVKDDSIDKKAAAVLRSRYPLLSASLSECYKRYNENVRIARDMERDGKAVIICPDDLNGLKTLTKDIKKLTDLYNSGYEKAGQILKLL
ncbi:MAG: patatin family protein [Clostridia bacterium]|nr:patatin family protein [Clostridia bacterium]